MLVSVLQLPFVAVESYSGFQHFDRSEGGHDKTPTSQSNNPLSWFGKSENFSRLRRAQVFALVTTDTPLCLLICLYDHCIAYVHSDAINSHDTPKS